MKIKYILISLFLISIACKNEEAKSDHIENTSENTSPTSNSMNPERLEAAKVNNLISGIQKSIVNMVEALFQADSSSIDDQMATLLFELEVNIKRVDALEDLPDLQPFKTAVIDLLKFYQFEIDTNFKPLVPLIYLSERTPDQQSKLTDYDAFFVKKEAALFNSVVKAQEGFAAANNIRLEN